MKNKADITHLFVDIGGVLLTDGIGCVNTGNWQLKHSG